MHALRNLTGKLPERHHRDLKARWWRVFDDAASPADARRALQAIIENYRAAITDNLDALIAHLRWPQSTANGSAQRTCLSAPSSKSAAAPRWSAAFPAKPAP